MTEAAIEDLVKAGLMVVNAEAGFLRGIEIKIMTQIRGFYADDADHADLN
jgi:hypothetical protein